MTLWTDSTWQPLYDGSPYTGTDGTRYPPGFLLDRVYGFRYF